MGSFELEFLLVARNTRTSTASVSKPTRLKSSTNSQIAMFSALYRGEADDSAFSR